jgi:hypothetical protein
MGTVIFDSYVMSSDWVTICGALIAMSFHSKERGYCGVVDE